MNRQLFFALFLPDVIALFLADVVAIVYVVDVITTRQMLCLFLLADVFVNFVYACGRCCCITSCGRCYCHLIYLTVADVTAIIICWLMLLPFNVCCYDCVADVVATMAGGIEKVMFHIILTIVTY